MEVNNDMIWDDKLNMIIAMYKELAREYKKMHEKYARIYNRRFYILGVSNLVIGTFSTFGTLILSSQYITPSVAIVMSIVLGNAIISATMSTISGLQTFLSYQQIAEKHNNATKDFESLERVCHDISQFPSRYKGNPSQVIRDIREQFNLAIDNAPLLPEKIDELKYTIRNNSSSKTGSSGSLHGPSPIEIEKLVRKKSIINATSQSGQFTINVSEIEKEERMVDRQVKKERRFVNKNCNSDEIFQIVKNDTDNTSRDVSNSSLDDCPEIKCVIDVPKKEPFNNNDDIFKSSLEYESIDDE